MFGFIVEAISNPTFRLHKANPVLVPERRAHVAVGVRGMERELVAELIRLGDEPAEGLRAPYGESSNLWNAFDRFRRNLPLIRLNLA